MAQIVLGLLGLFMVDSQVFMIDFIMLFVDILLRFFVLFFFPHFVFMLASDI